MRTTDIGLDTDHPLLKKTLRSEWRPSFHFVGVQGQPCPALLVPWQCHLWQIVSASSGWWLQDGQSRGLRGFKSPSGLDGLNLPTFLTSWSLKVCQSFPTWEVEITRLGLFLIFFKLFSRNTCTVCLVFMSRMVFAGSFMCRLHLMSRSWCFHPGPYLTNISPICKRVAPLCWCSPTNHFNWDSTSTDQHGVNLVPLLLRLLSLAGLLIYSMGCFLMGLHSFPWITQVSGLLLIGFLAKSVLEKLRCGDHPVPLVWKRGKASCYGR